MLNSDARQRAITSSGAPTPPLSRFLAHCSSAFAAENRGAVASYIPELSKAHRNHFGIALATIDGHVYASGDSEVPFTIQSSISKAFVFAVALETLGAERVEAKIGVEPSGEAFNSIRLRPDNRPFNPMVNAGAIACFRPYIWRRGKRRRREPRPRSWPVCRARPHRGRGGVRL